jgi:hypothetical protein
MSSAAAITTMELLRAARRPSWAARTQPLVVPPVPGRFLHVALAELTVGQLVLPGAALGWDDMSFGDPGRVHLFADAELARQWAAYLGERVDADRVAVYEVNVDALTGVRHDRRGILPLPQFEAASAAVEQLREWVDPWAGRPVGYREQLREVPF